MPIVSTPISRVRALVLVAASAAVAVPAIAAEGRVGTALASGGAVKAGLVTLCATDSFVRVGGINESNLDVTIGATETAANGKTVSYLGSNASDQLRNIFPITIPASSKYRVTWDLPLPATDNGRVRPGNSGSMHGSWGGGPWLDENGLTYVGTGGSAGRNGATCGDAAPASTSTTSTSSTTSTTTTSTSTTSTTAAAPTEPVVVRPRAVYSTINSQLAGRAVDGDTGTAFVTQMADWALPTWAWWTADLGEPVPLRSIRYTLARANVAKEFVLELSDDGRSWRPIGALDDDVAGAPVEAPVGATARLVRLRWRAPEPAEQLGHLSEIQFLADPGFVPTGAVVGGSVASVRSNFEFTVEPAAPAVTRNDRYVVQASSRSSNSPVNASRKALDGKADTAYRTAMTVPPSSGWVSFDLGSSVALGEVRWKFSELGFADAFRIQVSDNGSRWRTIATRTNAPTADTWQSLTTDRTARFVRFFFYNPNRDSDVGFLSEVRFYPPAPA